MGQIVGSVIGQVFERSEKVEKKEKSISPALVGCLESGGSRSSNENSNNNSDVKSEKKGSVLKESRDQKEALRSESFVANKKRTRDGVHKILPSNTFDKSHTLTNKKK